MRAPVPLALLAAWLLPGPGPASAESVIQAEVSRATGAVLRGLDKTAGEAVDLPLKVGETIGYGRLQITLGDCRYPFANLGGDAFAWLVIREGSAPEPLFEGWMIASSPGLDALDHPRYDVWVIRCTTE